jgi:ferrous iron transport protein A
MRPLSRFSSKPASVPGIRLGTARLRQRGVVVAVRGAEASDTTLAPEELERRLLELGFVEGAEVELLHEGFLRRDPIAVRVDQSVVALRRREANAILLAALD